MSQPEDKTHVHTFELGTGNETYFVKLRPSVSGEFTVFHGRGKKRFGKRTFTDLGSAQIAWLTLVTDALDGEVLFSQQPPY